MAALLRLEAVARTIRQATTLDQADNDGWPDPLPLTARIDPEPYPLDVLPCCPTGYGPLSRRSAPSHQGGAGTAGSRQRPGGPTTGSIKEKIRQLAKSGTSAQVQETTLRSFFDRTSGRSRGTRPRADTALSFPLATDTGAAWVAFHDAIESELRSGGELYDVRDVASKTADNAARIAV